MGWTKDAVIYAAALSLCGTAYSAASGERLIKSTSELVAPGWQIESEYAAICLRQCFQAN